MSRASDSVPLVARQAELTGLRAAWARAAEGRATTVLLAEDCIDLGGVGLPYLPFAQVLGAVHDLGADSEEVRSLLDRRTVLGSIAGVPEPRLDPAGDVGRLQLFDAVSGLLAELAAARPGVVLVLEDLHWADQSTRDPVRYLVARAGDTRLLIVGTYRSDDLHRRHPLRSLLVELLRQPDVERVDVHPFTEPELRQFATAVAGTEVGERRLRSVLERSEGNAYFAEELLEADEAGALPERLTDVLAARVDRLGPDAQHLVRLASVAGRRVTERLLRAVSELLPAPPGGGEVDDALRDAITHRVLEPDDVGHYAFRHALLAEAVYTDLLPGERARAHGAYARAIRDSGAGGSGPLGSAAELAHHSLAGQDLPAALSASVAAADEASRRLAPAESLQHLETALQLWAAVPDAEAQAGADVFTVGLLAAAAASHCGELPRAVALTRVAVQEAVATADVTKESVARRVLSQHLMSVEEPGVIEETTRAVELLTGEPADRVPTVPPYRELLLAAASHAQANVYADRDAAAKQWATWALEGARALEMPAVEAESLATLAVLSRDRSQRRDLLRRAKERAAHARDLTAELHSAYSLAAETFYAGETEAALVEAGEGQRRAQATGTTWSVWGIEMRVLEVVARYIKGDWDGSGRAGLLVGEAPPDLVAARLSAASLYVRTGRGDARTAEAAELLRPAWRLDGQIALVAGGCLADHLTWLGRPDEAVVVAREVIEFLARTWDDYFLGGIWLAALALAALADLDARPHPGHDRAGMTGHDGEVVRAEADRLLAHAEETAHRGRSRAGVLGPEGREWLTRVHAEHARMHGRDDVEAWRAAVEGFADWYPCEEARLALGGAERLGALPLTETVRDRSRRARLGLAPADAAPSELLTVREAEVLALVAEGLTNRAVGQRLFTSDKTVSVHLSHVMAKLGAGSRTEAVSVAHRRGLLPGLSARPAR